MAPQECDQSVSGVKGFRKVPAPAIPARPERGFFLARPTPPRNPLREAENSIDNSREAANYPHNTTLNNWTIMAESVDQPAETLFPEPTPTPEAPSPTNEPLGNGNPPVQASRLQKIVGATAGVFAKHGQIFKRGPGRPRKDGSPAASDIPITDPPEGFPVGAPGVPAPAAPVLDPELVKKCCGAVLKGLSSVLDRVVHRRAIASGVPPEKAKEIALECGITKEECDSFGELAAICLKKYNVGTEYAPEVGLVCVLAGVGVRYAVALKSFDAPPK